MAAILEEESRLYDLLAFKFLNNLIEGVGTHFDVVNPITTHLTIKSTT